PRPTVRDDPLRRWPSRTESRSDFNILRSSNGPMVTQRRQTQPWSSRARNDRVSTSPYLRCPAPSNRIATGTRTDSGEERIIEGSPSRHGRPHVTEWITSTEPNMVLPSREQICQLVGKSSRVSVAPAIVQLVILGIGPLDIRDDVSVRHRGSVFQLPQRDVIG